MKYILIYYTFSKYYNMKKRNIIYYDTLKEIYNFLNNHECVDYEVYIKLI